MRILMLLHKSVEHDSRVRREASALAEAGHEVTVAHLPAPGSFTDGPLERFQVVSVTPPRRLRGQGSGDAYRALGAAMFAWRIVRRRPDVVHAHDAAMLAPGLLGARLTGAQLVYDAHELATGVPYRRRLWAWLVRALERLAVPRCALVITVSDGIAERLRELYGLDDLPAVVRNVPHVGARGRPTAPDLRQLLGVGRAPLVLHQGSAAPGRGGEVLVRALSSLPEAHLVFLGVDPQGRDAARLRAAAPTDVRERLHLLAPVPAAELLAWTRQADVGVSLLEDSCSNHRLALPNKVFEYLAAGVPVVVSDLPELRRLLERYPAGHWARPDDPASVAGALADVLARDRASWPGLERAREELTWSRESDRLVRAYAALGEAGPHPAPHGR